MTSGEHSDKKLHQGLRIMYEDEHQVDALVTRNRVDERWGSWRDSGAVEVDYTDLIEKLRQELGECFRIRDEHKAKILEIDEVIFDVLGQLEDLGVKL